MFDKDHKESTQTAGDGALQVQAGNIVNIDKYYASNSGYENSPSREEVKQVVQEMLAEMEARLTHKFKEEYRNSANKLNTLIIPRLEEQGMLGAFEDPGFLKVLFEAYRTATLLKGRDSFDILSDLIVTRAAHPELDSRKIAIEKAISILDNMSDRSLKGLATYYCLLFIGPQRGDIFKGLDAYAGAFEELGVDDLPTGTEWLEEIDMLGAGRVSTISATMRPFEDLFSELFAGYLVKGIKPDSEEYMKAVNLLEKASLPKELLIPHELHKGYVRLPMIRESFVETDQLILPLREEDSLLLNLDDGKREKIKEIYRLTKGNDGIPVQEWEDMKLQLMNAVDKRKALHKVKEWWNQINVAIRINEAGVSLGYVYAKHNITNFPER